MKVNHHQALLRPMQTGSELREVLCKLINAVIACGATVILLPSTAGLLMLGTEQNIEEEPSASPKPNTRVLLDREDSSLRRRTGNTPASCPLQAKFQHMTGGCIMVFALE